MGDMNQETDQKRANTHMVKNLLQTPAKKKKHLLWIILVVAGLWITYKVFVSLESFEVLPHQAIKTPAKEKFQVNDFSPDGNKLYLDYCDVLNNCKIGWLDLSSNQVSLFAPQDTKDVISSPSSSDDGQELAIVIREASNNYETSQIGILDLATNTYRAVTKSKTFKEWPSLSHNGKEVIYAQANRKRGRGKTQFSEWDIYEVELATGVEHRLTNFCFFLVDRPKYMTDNKRFVFSGEEPGCNFPHPNTSYSHEGYSYEDYTNSQNGRALYKQLYQRNWNFMLTGNETTLE
ncbi:MAG: hypothetical protein WCA63_09360, partial [Gallionella sp.]